MSTPPKRNSRPSYYKEKTRYLLNSMLGGTTTCKLYLCVGVSDTDEDKAGESSYAGAFSLLTYEHWQITLVREQFLLLKTLTNISITLGTLVHISDLIIDTLLYTSLFLEVHLCSVT